jgi:hypothetical protein
MRRRPLLLVLAALTAALALGTGASAWWDGFSVKPREFDPGKTYLVQAEWLAGVGCPTNAKVANANADGTGVGSYGSYSDPACPTGDSRDRKNEGLVLAKTGPTGNFAAAVADVKGVAGRTLTELGWDIRKPGLDTPAGPRGSHCGAGAPRWNIATTDGGFYFIGCNSPTPVFTPGEGYQRHRWGAGVAPLLAYNAFTGTLDVLDGKRVESLQIVFDEGYDVGPDNFGLAVLDNIDVSGDLVGRGPGDGDRDDDDEDDDDGDGPKECKRCGDGDD